MQMPNVFKMKIRNCKKKKITSLNPLYRIRIKATQAFYILLVSSDSERSCLWSYKRYRQQSDDS